MDILLEKPLHLELDINMAIGYANFEDIQRGNQQVVNSMASLGQQIAGSIENHAQTQAATAMLPALQQSLSLIHI